MLKHLNITVTGKVQGVYFRAYTQSEAKKLGLTGFVCNLPNGNVYIEVEGESGELQKLIFWCKSGSPNAKVKDVVSEEGIINNFTDFIIKR